MDNSKDRLKNVLVSVGWFMVGAILTVGAAAVFSYLTRWDPHG